MNVWHLNKQNVSGGRCARRLLWEGLMCVMGEKFKQFTWTDRIRMETLLNAGHKPAEIAEILNFHLSSIYREKKKGAYMHTLPDWSEEERYSADLAQGKANENKTHMGPDLKLGKHYEFANRIEELIADDKYSPAAALAQCEKEGIEFKVCVTTLYSYIDKGVFGKVTNKELPSKKDKGKRKYKRVAKRVNKGESIENRPKEIETREEFGHWEMDTVVGKQGVTKKSLLVLTERKTRREIIMMLKRHNTEYVVKAMDRIERKYGSKVFRMMFKTVTVDNGSEFQDYEGMERSRRNKKKRTKIYYCHPYCSSERGSNENQNKLIRRHIPKGMDFDDRTQGDADFIENWMNNYPREIFGFKTSNDLFEEEMAKLMAS